MDITPLLSYVKSTSHLALSCNSFAWRVRSNGFPIRTSEGGLCLENFSFYKLLEYPGIDKWTNNAFYNAIDDDNTNRLQLLLDKGANIEAKGDDGDTALIKATRTDKTRCLKLLLMQGADIDARDKDGLTVLMWAAWGNRSDCLKILLGGKADTEAKSLGGYTALELAARAWPTNCLKPLLEGGAKVEPRVRESFPQYAALWEKYTL